jgi:hypothetical protein
MLLPGSGLTQRGHPHPDVKIPESLDEYLDVMHQGLKDWLDKECIHDDQIDTVFRILRYSNQCIFDAYEEMHTELSESRPASAAAIVASLKRSKENSAPSMATLLKKICTEMGQPIDGTKDAEDIIGEAEEFFLRSKVKGRGGLRVRAMRILEVINEP